MAAVPPPHRQRAHAQGARTALDALWAVAVGIIAAYAFFVVLGAFAPGDVLVVTIVVAALAAFCVLRVVAGLRAKPRRRDPGVVHGRKRRGF